MNRVPLRERRPALLVAALDTATLTLSCALCEVRGEEVVLVAERIEHAAARKGPQGPTGGHGGRLPGALSDLLVSVDRKLPEIDAYAVGLGPGSFTGLRIGLATWKGLAYANRRPIAGASSLAAMALAAARLPGPAAGATLFVPLLDAKKGEVYAGFYRAVGASVEAAAPDAVLPPGALLDRLAALRSGGARPVLFGEGLAAYRAQLDHEPVLEAGSSASDVATPRALHVATLCATALAGAGYDQARLFAMEPRYVRASEAELKFPQGFPPGGPPRA